METSRYGTGVGRGTMVCGDPKTWFPMREYTGARSRCAILQYRSNRHNKHTFGNSSLKKTKRTKEKTSRKELRSN